MIENKTKQRPVDALKAQVPPGFEAAHVEWLKLGGQNICHKYRHGSQKKFYQSVYWKLIREAVFRRDGYRCCRCGEAAEQVHHLAYLHRGEDHFFPQYLVSICRRCHILLELAQNDGALYGVTSADHLTAITGSASDTPLAKISRLLKFRARFEGLRKGYEKAILCTSADLENFQPSHFRFLGKNRDGAIESEAQALLDSWTLTEDEKSARISTMIAKEVRECTEFMAELLGPLSGALRTAIDQEKVQRVSRAELEKPSTLSHPLGKCPICGGLVFETGWDYACENRGAEKSPCNFRIPKAILCQSIDHTQVSKLLANGQTDLLNGFTSVTGRTFSAYLVISASGEVRFKFAP